VLKDKVGIEDWRLKFAGFGGNNETKQGVGVEISGAFGRVIAIDQTERSE